MGPVVCGCPETDPGCLIYLCCATQILAFVVKANLALKRFLFVHICPAPKMLKKQFNSCFDDIALNILLCLHSRVVYWQESDKRILKTPSKNQIKNETVVFWKFST